MIVANIIALAVAAAVVWRFVSRTRRIRESIVRDEGPFLAEGLAKLLRFGLVKPSFVPAREFRELRQLTRYRRAVVQTRASEQNRVEKHLQIAGVPGRNEPSVGEINYPYLFRLIDSLGYVGWIGCEYKPKGKTAEGLGWIKELNS